MITMPKTGQPLSDYHITEAVRAYVCARRAEHRAFVVSRQNRRVMQVLKFTLDEAGIELIPLQDGVSWHRVGADHGPTNSGTVTEEDLDV